MNHNFPGRKARRRNAEERSNILKIFGAAAGGMIIGALVFLLVLLIMKSLA